MEEKTGCVWDFKLLTTLNAILEKVLWTRQNAQQAKVAVVSGIFNGEVHSEVDLQIRYIL